MSVTSEARGGVLVITIDRPHARNAIDRAVAEGIAAALDRLDADDALAVGIITGAGGYFSAGMDLKAFAAGEPSYAGGRGFAGIVQRPPDTPLIAAIEGFAVAGGFEIALSCDLIVAARGAKLGIPEVKRSLVASGGALLRLPSRIPYHVAMELALTGDPISAERGHGLGLVNRLAEPGGALDAALELAAAITPNGPLALAATKRILLEAPSWPAGTEWARQQAIAGPVFASEDAREGAVAFAEKRPPVWRGR
jgi:enoyl-CoA hydratase